MKQNIGKTDRTIRLVLALVIAGLGIYYRSAWGYLSLLPLTTAWLGNCPLYTLLGISTCSINKTPVEGPKTSL